MAKASGANFPPVCPFPAEAARCQQLRALAGPIGRESLWSSLFSWRATKF